MYKIHRAQNLRLFFKTMLWKKKLPNNEISQYCEINKVIQAASEYPVHPQYFDGSKSIPLFHWFPADAVTQMAGSSTSCYVLTEEEFSDNARRMAEMSIAIGDTWDIQNIMACRSSSNIV